MVSFALQALRNLDRKWAEADDVQLGIIKALFCFGFCLPRSSRDAVRQLESKKLADHDVEQVKPKSKPKTEQPRMQPIMRQPVVSARPKDTHGSAPPPRPARPDERPAKPPSIASDFTRNSQKKQRGTDDESDSGSSGLELPDIRRMAGSVPPRDEQVIPDGIYCGAPSPHSQDSGNNMVGFLRNDPEFTALSDEQKLVVIRHMLENAQQGV